MIRIVSAELRRLIATREARIGAVLSLILVCGTYYISFPPARDLLHTPLTQSDAAAIGVALSPQVAPMIGVGLASSLPGLILIAFFTALTIGTDYQGTWHVLLTKEPRRIRVMLAKLFAVEIAYVGFCALVIVVLVAMSVVLGPIFDVDGSIPGHFRTPPIGSVLTTLITASLATVAATALITLATQSRLMGWLGGIAVIVADALLYSSFQPTSTWTISESVNRTYQWFDPLLRSHMTARIWPTAVESLLPGVTPQSSSFALLAIVGVMVAAVLMLFDRQELS